MISPLDKVLAEVAIELERLNKRHEPFIPYYIEEDGLRIVVSRPPLKATL